MTPGLGDHRIRATDPRTPRGWIRCGPAVLAVALLAGCGSTPAAVTVTQPPAAPAPAAAPDPKAPVRAAAHAYFVAIADQDYAAVCRALSSASQQRLVSKAAILGAHTCIDAARVGLGSTGRDETDPLRTDPIIVLRLKGARATIRRQHGKTVLRLRRYGSTWLVDNAGK